MCSINWQLCNHWGFFSSTLCYCTAELLSSRGRPSVDILFSETVKWIDTKFYWQVYLHHISKPFVLFFKILNFWFFTFFFSDHMGVKISNDIPSQSTYQIHSQKSCILLQSLYQSLYQSCSKNCEISNFGFLAIFFLFFFGRLAW